MEDTLMCEANDGDIETTVLDITTSVTSDASNDQWYDDFLVIAHHERDIAHCASEIEAFYGSWEKIPEEIQYHIREAIDGVRQLYDEIHSLS